MESKCIDHGFKGDSHGYCRTTRIGFGDIRLHRYVYCKTHSLTKEDIVGKVIRHTCDNPRCINPEHLLIGTQRDNVQDRVERNRSYSILTPDKVVFIRKHYKFRDPEFGQTALARRFGVTKEAVYSVIHRRNWRD